MGFITDVDTRSGTFEIYGFDPIPLNREVEDWDEVDCTFARKTYDIGAVFGIEHDIMPFMSPDRVKVVNFYLENKVKVNDRGTLFLTPKNTTTAPTKPRKTPTKPPKDKKPPKKT